MKLADAVQPPQEKPVDPHVALEKLLRLLRKHTNFDYVDPSRKVQYPSLLGDSPPNQHLLRNFWRHCQNLYFRMPQQSQLSRLDYFSDIIHSQLSHELPFRPNQHFWKNLEGVFNPVYLQKQYQSLDKNLDTQNWLCTLYLYNHLLQNQEGKPNKKVEKQLKKLASIKDVIEPVSNYKRYYSSLQIENEQLKRLLPEKDEDDDEVLQQIKQFEADLQSTHNQTVNLFNQLIARVSHQEQEKKMIYCFGNQQEDVQLNQAMDQQSAIFGKISSVEDQLKYLEYTIAKLQKKQIAESISKITKYEKSRGENKFHITFQEAMNVKKKYLSEKQLLQLNKKRQYSLFKFYNTSLKTPYSFICQNSFGFREIYLKRNEPCKYKNKNILQQLKKSGQDPYEVSKAYQKFDICHHCKLLYPENFLVKCKYSSDRMGVPIQPAPYCDSYISQISKIQTAKSQRYLVRKRNCYQNYTKINDQYVCNRKFCKYCLRQNYQDGLDKNGLCPFCQGICFCTRCARNDMIVRLKSIYLLLGGEMSRFLDDKFLEYQNQQTDQEQTNSVRKKGRPKKVIRRPISAPNKATDRKNNIRMQLQPLRLLCDMIKKRQKMKVRYYESQQEFFIEKLGFISKQLIFLNTNKSKNLMADEAEIAKMQKIRKKLNRMI